MVTNSSKVQQITAPLKLSDDQLRKMMQLLEIEMKRGLGKETNSSATVKMFPTYVRAIPKGTETGKFLALDLGGTNFRVLLIDLKGKQVKMSSKIFNVPTEVMTGTGDKLFDHIADCIFRFMQAEGVVNLYLPLGFTFSFPCSQMGLASAKLTKWTKGFSASDVEGHDVAVLLKAAIKRRGDFDVDIVAVVNDTTGTLMSCAHSTPNCYMGLIIGTGYNAAFFLPTDEIERWDGDNLPPRECIINTEWGAFGDNGVLDYILTEFDKTLDTDSMNPKNQRYEKMVSGMYLGELVRLVLVKLCEAGQIFGGKLPPALKKKDAFYTKYISEIEGEPQGTFVKCMKILKEELGIKQATLEDADLVRHCCMLVSTRAAAVAGAGVAAALNHMNRPMCSVGVDGSVYKYHPHFHNLMTEYIGRLINPNLKFKLVLSEDGSGKGAALIAAVSTQHAGLTEQNGSK